MHEDPVAPPVPSFESLRAPRRRSPIDLLPPPPPAPVAEPVAAPRAAPVPAPRPPDYADLLRLGVHVARLSAGVPLRPGRSAGRARRRFPRGRAAAAGPLAGRPAGARSAAVAGRLTRRQCATDGSGSS